MSYIFPPPGDDVALFTKRSPKKPKKPMPWWLNFALLLYASAIARGFGYVGAQFGLIAFHHRADPHAMAGMVVGLVMGTVALVATAVASKTSLNLLGMA